MTTLEPSTEPTTTARDDRPSGTSPNADRYQGPADFSGFVYSVFRPTGEVAPEARLRMLQLLADAREAALPVSDTATSDDVEQADVTAALYAPQMESIAAAE